MHIAATNWNIGVGHALGAHVGRSQRMLAWTGQRPVDTPANPQPPAAERTRAPATDPTTSLMDRLERHARQLRAQAAPPPPPTPPPAPGGATADASDDTAGDPKTRQMQLILEKMFGIKHIASISFSADASHASASGAQTSTAAAQTGTPGQAGWGLEYDYQETYAEAEVLTLAAKGTFTTDDGRSFAFSLDYRMERTFVQQRSVNVRAGDAVVRDPLLLDLGGQGLGFTNQTVPLDLDQDGRSEALPVPTLGNWYLTRGAQTPTSGLDLFGPASGAGFDELATWDDDRNGFIDAGDSRFSALHLWSGQGAPIPLSRFGIGALGVMSVDAPFRHADAGNATQALNRRSGLYLTDDGRAGVIHQVDVAG